MGSRESHSDTVPIEPLAHKGKIEVTLDPGEELAALVWRLRGSRPVWRVGSQAAPRIEWLAARGPDGPISVRPPELRFDPRPYMLDGTWEALETGHPVACKRLRPRERKQLRYMFAAIMRDIQGSSLGEIVDTLGSEFKDERGVAHPEFGKRRGFADDRAARRAVEMGRRLWCRLPAWPWAWFSGGQPPRDWRTAGPDATLAAALESWVTGRPILPSS